MCEKNVPTTGQIVYCKPNTLFEKILGLISADSKSVLIKKISRPYVVISNKSANQVLKTVWVCPLKSVNSTENLSNKVIYMDKQGSLREIVTSEIMTVQTSDICWDNFFLPLSVMTRVREKILLNLPYDNKEDREVLKAKTTTAYVVDTIVREEA